MNDVAVNISPVTDLQDKPYRTRNHKFTKTAYISLKAYLIKMSKDFSKVITDSISYLHKPILSNLITDISFVS